MSADDPIGTLAPEDLEQFSSLQKTEHDLHVAIGRYVVEMINLASQATQVRLQNQRLGEKIREDFGIPPNSHIRLSGSGEVFLVED